jgi:pSer/pThr/pTyr-binding forkhead associated (FHA) protein
VYCSQCGHGNSLDARFCSSCGVALGTDETTVAFPPLQASGESEVEPAAMIYERIEMAMLVSKRGANAGSRFSLKDELTVAGRHPDSDIFLDDVTVSRRHAEIVHADHSYVLRDVGSLNGTYLNQERIDREMTLHDGDEVQIGRFKLVFVSGTETPVE